MRVLTAACMTLLLVGVWGVGWPFTRFREDRRIAWRGFIVHHWARLLAGILGMRVHVTGTPPTPPFCLVANHLSYIDVILLHSQLRCVFVSKAEVSRWPALGWLARTFGTLFIDRTIKRDVLRINSLIDAVLQAGDGIVFFPEGTTSQGDRVYPFKASLLDLAARSGYPVQYATLRYETPPGELPAVEGVCWWGKMTFGGHLKALLRLRSFDAYVHFGADAVQADDRKELAHLLHEKVAAHFVPVPGAQDAAVSVAERA